MPVNPKQKHHRSGRHSRQHKPDRVDIDIDIDLVCEPVVNEQNVALVETLYNVNRQTADLKTATALWGSLAHAKQRLRQQQEQLLKQQTSVVTDTPIASRQQDDLTETETLRLVLGLLKCNDAIDGEDNKRILVSAIFDILRLNPSIMKRHQKFEKTVKSKCIQMMTQYNLAAAQQLYDQEWGKKEPRS